MTRKRLQPLITGGILVAVLLILRLILPQLLPPVAAAAAAFLTVFLAILLAFIFLIVFVSSELGGKVPRRLYRIIEAITIAGIILGVVGMFQPWTLVGYRIAFNVLLASTLAFTLWSHVEPGPAYAEGAVDVDDYERMYQE